MGRGLTDEREDRVRCDRDRRRPGRRGLRDASAQGGLDVAIIENDLVGGECSFYACMPSKALLRPAEVLAEIKRVPGAAEAVAGGIDAEAALARRDEVIHDLDDSAQLPWLEDLGVELFRGQGRLTGELEVEVEGHRADRPRGRGALTGQRRRDAADRRSRRGRGLVEPGGHDREEAARL